MPYVDGEFVAVSDDDLKEGDIRPFKLGEKYYLVLVKLGGEYRCIDDWCNHAGCLLSDGYIEDNALVCPCHYVSFSLETGEVISEPRICDDQPAFETRVVDGKVEVRFSADEMPY